MKRALLLLPLVLVPAFRMVPALPAAVHSRALEPGRIYLLNRGPWLSARLLPDRPVLELETASGRLLEAAPCSRLRFTRFLRSSDREGFIRRHFPDLLHSETVRHHQHPETINQGVQHERREPGLCHGEPDQGPRTEKPALGHRGRRLRPCRAREL